MVPAHILPELGQVALALALLVSLLQAMLPLLGAHRGIAPLMAVARPAAFLQLVLVGFAFVLLTHGFVTHDFSLPYVAENSNSLLPLKYRFTAVWGAHEGSLSVGAIIALWTAAVEQFAPACRCRWSPACSGWGVVSIGFLAFLIFTAIRRAPAAGGRRSRDLIAAQDPGMTSIRRGCTSGTWVSCPSPSPSRRC